MEHRSLLSTPKPASTVTAAPMRAPSAAAPEHDQVETAAGDAAPSVESIMIGRDYELGRIHRALTSNRAGIVLAGPAGVGKTRLVTEGLLIAERYGHATKSLAAFDSDSDISLGLLAHLMPARQGPGSHLDAVGRLAQTLGARRNGRRLVLSIDNAHHMDAGSAALIYQLASAGHLFVVAAVLSGHGTPHGLTSLWKEHRAERLEIAPLEQHEIADVLAATLDGDVSVPTTQLLWDASRGNMVFLQELIAVGLDTGALRPAPYDIWSWHGPLQVSPRLVEMVETGYGELEDAETAIVEALAQCESVDAAVMEERFSAGALHSAEARGLIVSGGHHRVTLRLSNTLLGQVIRARMTPLRSRAARRELAESIVKASAPTDLDALHTATLGLDSGTHVPAQLLRVAEDQAFAAFEDATAERIARVDKQAGGGPTAALVLAQSLMRQGRFADALAELELVGPAKCAADRARATVLRAQIEAWGLGHLDAALALVGPPARRRSADAVAAALRAALLLLSGQSAAAHDAASTVLTSGTTDSDALAPAATVQSVAAAILGRDPAAGLSVLPWPYDLDGAAPLQAADLLAASAPMLRTQPSLDGAAADCQARYRAAVAAHDLRSATSWSALLGRVTLDQGYVRQGRRWLHEALMLAEGCAPRTILAPCTAWLAEAEAMLGNHAAAVRWIRAAESELTDATALFGADVGIARAWMAGVGGELPDAVRLLRDVARQAADRGQNGTAIVAAHTAVRFGARTKAAEMSRRLAESVGSPLSIAFATHAAAIVSGDGIQLDAAAHCFESAGARLLAAEAYSAAAIAHDDVGQRGRSRMSRAATRSLVDQCGGVRTPALIDFKSPTLTRREREIALLAEQGMSSRSIAERLTLSVRTVDNHLQTVYGKLCINGRSGLAAAFGDAH